MQYGQFDTYNIEVDAQVPVTEKFSLGLGASLMRIDNDAGNNNLILDGGVIARLRPSDSSELVAFGGLYDNCHNEQQPQIFTGGPYLPPQYQRRTFFGQDWTTGACRDSNAGVLGRAAVADWTLRASAFRSGSIQRFYGDMLRDIQPNGIGRHSIFSQLRQSFVSYSGEVRASRAIAEAQRRHTIDLVLRGRDLQRDFGGTHTIDFGTARIAERVTLPEPVFTYGPLTDDHTRQITAGASYTGLWAGVGGISDGVQKSFYRCEIAAPNVALTQIRTAP